MRIRFVTPPAAKRIGGIENAVEGLREALLALGIEVIQGGDPSDTDAVHHFHGLWDPSYIRLAARLRKLDGVYVISPHGMLEPWAFRHRRWKKLPYFWLIERSFLRGAAALFVTSAMEAEHLQRIIRHQKVEILPIGCRDRRSPDYEAARQSLGWPRHERILLFLSRIDVKKGVDLLLQSLESKKEVLRDCRLVIVGDGDSEYVNCLKVAATAAVGNLAGVEWVGPVWGDERWPYLQGADLFCLPTHSENFGIAVLEALHAGTPVLTTDQTPWRDHSSVDGIFICKPDAASISDGLGRILTRLSGGWTGENRNALSDWAGEKFAWDNLVGDYVKSYERAMRHGER